MTHKIIKTDNYLLVVDDSRTIGKGYALNTSYKLLLKYDTDQHLAYDNDVVKKIIAHVPLNGSPILEGVPLLPPYSRHQEDGLEDYAQSCNKLYKEWLVTGYKSGYNKAREKYKYTEEDMRKAIDLARLQGPESFLVKYREEEVIQSLHQYPTEFECEMEEHSMDMPNIHHKIYKPKTITTTQGVQWIGKYK